MLPISPPRKTSSAIKIGDYNISESTLIYSNTYTVHMDPSYWGDPEVFRPERFVVDGRFTPNDRNIPFGVGRRRCLGETLARMENFLIFANLMKSFSFRSGDGNLPGFRQLAGLTNALMGHNLSP